MIRREIYVSCTTQRLVPTKKKINKADLVEIAETVCGEIIPDLG
jgi:hypothetical protein